MSLDLLKNSEVFTQINFDYPFGKKHNSINYNLSNYFHKVYSQHGEDGLLNYLFSIITPRKKYYVDFGAADGHFLANTKFLREHLGWTGLLMEGDPNLVNRSNGLVKQELVTPDNIMNLFEKHNVPEDFDFLSIDIDGDDIYVFDSIDTQKYKPSVIIAEYNPGLPNHLPLAIEKGKSDYFINPHLPKNKYFPCYHGCNINAWYTMSKRKGYTIITTCGVNVVMVRDDHVNKFNVPSLEDLVYPPYFVKEQDRFNLFLELNDNYRWKIIS